MRIVLYTKPDCHLCDVVKFELIDLQDEYGFVFDEKNILLDEALHREFRLVIPVVDIYVASGTEDNTVVDRLQAPINQLDLRRRVRAAVERERKATQAGWADE